MSKGRTTRIYWRPRSYGVAAYGDFRDYADVGGGQEALIPTGETRPTADAQRHLDAACDLLGADTNLRDITVTMVSEAFLTGLDGWVARRTGRKGRRPRPL